MFSYYGPYLGLSFRSGYADGYYSGRDYQTGGLDLNVKPKKTGVYLDGQYIGTTGSYDGYPRYLWVEEGYHEITFFLEGFRNETRRVRVQAGVIIDLSFKMQPGEAVQPEEEVRSADQEMDRGGRQWPNDRYSPRREDDRVDGGGAPRQDSDRRLDRDLRPEPGRIRLNIEPADATVYIDGRFLGTGSELSKLNSGLIIESGKHKLDVVRPGFDGETVDFLLDAGSELELEVLLIAKGQQGPGEEV